MGMLMIGTFGGLICAMAPSSKRVVADHRAHLCAFLKDSSLGGPVCRDGSALSGIAFEAVGAHLRTALCLLPGISRA